MNWLSQNWFWVALAVAIAWWLLRSGLAGHGRHGHAGGHGRGAGGLLGGLGGHEGHGGSHGGHDEPPERPATPDAPEAAVDPVGGEAVRTAQALTSVHQGKIYYFASKENRDRFEAAPHEYAHKAAGHPARSAEAAQRPRRRHGC